MMTPGPEHAGASPAGLREGLLSCQEPEEAWAGCRSLGVRELQGAGAVGATGYRELQGAGTTG